MDILKLRKKLVDAQELLIDVNEALLKEYQKGGYDAGCGCTVPGLTKTDKSNPRDEPPCCGE